MNFDGKTYDEKLDGKRLWTSLRAARDLLEKHQGEWFTLREIQDYLSRDYHVASSEAGISARFRDLRKAKHGGLEMESRRVGGGLWEYRMKPPFQLEFST